MRAPDFQPFAAGTAALLLVASMAWWLLSAPELADPGQPTWKGADIVRMKAAVPEISPFGHFYVNHDNPFVPHNLRLAEGNELDPNRRPPRIPPQPPQHHVVKPLPPKDPVKVVEPAKPILVLPKLTRPTANAPIAYGLLVKDGQQLLIVRMPDAQESMNLKPGDQIAGWTLISIDSGNLATFLDPQGIEHRFAIGEGDLAVVHSEGAALVPGKKTTDPAGMMPKFPVPGGKQSVPGARPPGVDGPIPRPPPRDERRTRQSLQWQTPVQWPTPEGQPAKDPQSAPVPKK